MTGPDREPRSRATDAPAAEAAVQPVSDSRFTAPVRRRRRWGRIVAGLTGAALVVFLLTPTGCYLSRAGWEEAKILAGRRQIVRLVDDPTTAPATRARLQLVLAARGFAADSIRLRTGESFTTYSHLERDTLVLVVSGAYRDRLEPYTWWFPIVGRVPYKGFFDFGAAQSLARDLERRGYDTYVRPSAAFSTLGWFNDPLLSTTLRLDSINLANTVIHEVTHNTFYKSGEAVFNESFANFVGARGSAWFFRSRGDSTAAKYADADWDDDKRMGAFWATLYRSLDSAYKAHPGDSARAVRLAVRDTVYARGREHLIRDVAPLLRTISPDRVARIRIDNNAALLARRIYLTDLELFDRVWEREGRDLRRTIERVILLAKDADDPYVAVKQWLGEP
jgi:predicted aminopeptidase